MRPFAAVIVVTCALACGGSSPGQQQQSAAPKLHQLSVSVGGGGGRVTSSPGGIDCGTICAASFTEGAAVALTAVPDPGSMFAGWEGACSGTGTCSVTLNADASVTAHFAAVPPPPPPPPPPPQTFTLTVSVTGSGTVTSDPAGIDCGSRCSATFAAGTRVQLSAQPRDGMTWQAECLPLPTAVGLCYIDMSKDQTATATFNGTPPPPPPQDECAGLMPGSVPAAIPATMPQAECIDGTSDDGVGTFLLGYFAGGGPVFPAHQFVQIQNGSAVVVGSGFSGSDEGATGIFSQPSGFTVLSSGPSGGTTMASYTHDGTLLSSQQLVLGDFAHFPSVSLGVDPGGGSVVAAHRYNGTSWVTTYRRFDKTGVAETGEITIDTSDSPVVDVGVDLAGHALVLVSINSVGLAARWMDRDGTPLTAWFPFPGGFGRFQFLMEGGLAYGRFTQTNDLEWVGWFHDGATASVPLPGWLQQRTLNTFYAVRNGTAYATWNRDGASCVEVLATSTGKSCGCVEVRVPARAAIGRDGSLMVPGGTTQCVWSLYPQLLK